MDSLSDEILQYVPDGFCTEYRKINVQVLDRWQAEAERLQRLATENETLQARADFLESIINGERSRN